MEDEKYALPLPRGITTGIVFEAVEKFGLEIGQEEQSDDAFDPRTDLPTKDYVPRMVLWSNSQETLMEAKEYIFKKHEEWINGLEDWRKMRMDKIMRCKHLRCLFPEHRGHSVLNVRCIYLVYMNFLQSSLTPAGKIKEVYSVNF